MEKIKFLVETYLDYQKDRIQLENRLRSLPEQFVEETFFKSLAKDVKELEKSLYNEMVAILENEPLFIHYLSHQKGIGPTMSAYLIAWLAKPREFKIFGVTKKVDETTYIRKWKNRSETIQLPPYATITQENLKAKYISVSLPPVMEVAQNPSDLHKYCGVIPGSKLRRGEKVAFNPKLKTLMWKILTQLLLAQGAWSKIFNEDKSEYAKRCPQPEKGSLKMKIHLTAKNIIMRKFMTNLWLVYRWMNNLPTTEPYPSKLGHTITKPFIETPDGIKYITQENVKKW